MNEAETLKNIEKSLSAILMILSELRENTLKDMGGQPRHPARSEQNTTKKFSFTCITKTQKGSCETLLRDFI